MKERAATVPSRLCSDICYIYMYVHIEEEQKIELILHSIHIHVYIITFSIAIFYDTGPLEYLKFLP